MMGAQGIWATGRQAWRDERARARTLVRSEEVDFLPAAIEIVERPVSPTARYTAWVLMLGLAVALLWLIFGQIDVVASAPGQLIPADNVKLIQPADAGVVRSILVRDNQSVHAGQALLELDPTMSSADAIQARRALEAAELDAARGRAMLSSLDGHGLRFVPPPGTSPEMTELQIALARAQLEGIKGETGAHDADRQAASATYAEATLSATKLAETLPLVDEQIEANQKLLAKGYVSKLRVIEMRRQRLGLARDRQIALETAAKARAQMAQASASRTQSVGTSRARILEDLTKAEVEARLRREEMVKASRRSALQRLVSPIDGTVAQLSVHTVGGVVEVGKPLMLIVPARGELVAKVKIFNKDIGFVRAGQDVGVKLAAFPFTRHGVVVGRIESISTDAIEDEKLGLVYTARVTMDRQWHTRDGRLVQLVPGMEVTADIRTGRRSVGSYLLSPLQAIGEEAGRER
ncbi:HlyD family type I secretion periplasmic adaptor subunit [Sphingobium yanoikuyae]|uniref:HlyD family type I secretion periplasmic adaptor subunit n=1 Tax=Sphingobium yanoikuyae TaxID=13690 RepID=UPI0028ACC7B5|nr:HlyD family type I secretion periplasmic adaptor subunit [Sphingobium yanoikuyae]